MSTKIEQINPVYIPKQETDDQIVPVETSDLETPEIAPTHHSRKEIIKKMAKWATITLVAISTAFGVYSAVKSFGNGNGTPEIVPPATTDSSTGSESTAFTSMGDETEVIVTTNETTQNTTESQDGTEVSGSTSGNENTQETEIPTNWFELDWSKQNQELQNLNSISTENYRKDTKDNQLLYCMFLNDIYFTQYKEDGITGGIYSENMSASLDDSAQEIVDQQKNKLTMIDSAAGEDGKFDKEEARKLLSFLVFDINTVIDSSDSITKNAETFDKLISEVPDGAILGKVVDLSALDQTGTDKSEIRYYSDKTPYVVLKMVEAEVTTYNEYAFVTIKNAQGEQESTWLLGKVSTTPTN